MGGVVVMVSAPFHDFIPADALRRRHVAAVSQSTRRPVSINRASGVEGSSASSLALEALEEGRQALCSAAK